MSALRYSIEDDGNSRLQLCWDPSGSYVDVEILIRNCIPSLVSLRDYSTDQVGGCTPQGNYSTSYEFFAPIGNFIFTKRYRLNCRTHHVGLKVVDQNGSQTSMANATAPI